MRLIYSQIYLTSPLILGLLLFSSPAQAKTVNLAVPFVSETPDGVWKSPWNNACEEASITMVDQFYLGQEKVSRAKSKQLMLPLFSAENKIFGSNADSNSVRTQKIINDYSAFYTTTKTYPTLEDIKTELEAGRPVISLHYGFDLKNPLIPFRRDGSSYHVMVVKGYDDENSEFIVNDPAVAKGLDFRYDYDIFLNSLHDFNHQTGKADGPPRVLFTRFDKLIAAQGGKTVYLEKNNTKFPILNPGIIAKYGWKWDALRFFSPEKINTIPTGPTIAQ